MSWYFLIEQFGEFRHNAIFYVGIIEPAQFRDSCQQKHHHFDHLLVVREHSWLTHEVAEQVLAYGCLFLQLNMVPVIRQQLLEGRCSQVLRVLITRLLNEVLQIWQILNVLVVHF